MTIEFPFEDSGKMYFGRIYRPVAKVSFYAPQFQTWTQTWMIVDTGADFSILPRFLSKIIGISLEKDCITDTTMGVGGEQKIYLCKKKVKAQIGTMKREVPIAFFANDEVPAILGRCGFLETFDIEFLKDHIVQFKG